MKIIFFGTPQFAVPALQKLVESNHEVVAVVTRADKPAGRGRKLTASAVKQFAMESGIAVHQPESVKTEEFATLLSGLKADIGVVVAYGKILPKRILDVPKFGCLNIHASLLPKYRGAAPIQWAIVRGENKTGVTIMHMNEGLDTGPIVAVDETDILDDDDAISLMNLLSFSGASLLIEALAKIETEQRVDSVPQDDSQATLAPLIKRDMARIDWSMRADQIICMIHGFVAWPKAFTTLKSEEVKIIAADAWAPEWVPATAFDKRVIPGTVVDIAKGRGIVVRTGGERGLVLVTQVQLSGKGEVSAQDLVNGGSLDVGAIFGH